MNLELTKKKKIVADDYDSIAVTYGETYNGAEEFRDQLQRFINNIPKDAVILDAGAANGHESNFFYVSGFHQVISLDTSQAMLDDLSKRYPQLTPMLGSIEDIKFSDGSVDAIWSARTIIHVPPEIIDKVLDELVRVLADGGRLALIFLSTSSEDNYMEELMDEPLSRDPGIQYYRVNYNSPFISKLLKDRGMQLELQEECFDRDGDRFTFLMAEKVS